MSWPQRTWVRETGQTALTGLLCGFMVIPQAAFAAGARVPKRPERQAPLTQQERVLHVLNRFTFGPRPGEVEEVEKMGLERWFQQQLQPQTIDDSAFEERMNEFPAMRLSQDDLMQQFPSQAMIRMSERRDVSMPMPHDRVQKAIFADARYEYAERQKAQALLGGAAGQPAVAGQGMLNGVGNQAAKNQAANEAKSRREMMAGLAALDQSDAASTKPNPPVAAMKPPVRMGHPDSAASQNNDDMQASMEMAGGGAMSNGEMAQQPGAMELNKKGKAKAKDLADPMDRDDVLSVLAMPPDQRVERLVEMKPDEMMDFKAALNPVQKLLLVRGMSPDQEEIASSFITAPERVIGAEILESRMERDVFSERQLQAVMTDFWLNHFSVYARKNENEPYYLPAYERDVILPNALGRFENLLVAVAQSPAMLMYLDNWESVGPNSVQALRAQQANFMRPNAKKQQPKGINENYGRELMELHTLGVNGGYTQKDVIEVSKCFTGWTIDKPAQGGQAYFDEARHEPGTKMVLGHKIKENGQKEGLEVLHILATSPATAHFISEKLAVRFVSDDPPAALVNRMAATFLKTDGNIKAVLSTMYHSPEFWSPRVYRAKVKTPVEFMASALRASGADVKSPLPLVQAMDRLGMPIYGMQTPQGYSWKADDWVSSNALISRMNFALVLSSNREPGTKTDWPVLLGDTDGAPAPMPDVETENKLEIALLGEPASDRTRSVVLA
ncbi:MAG TPA: DUF1800 family protein, partial [Terriglobales bacterium]